MSRYTPLHKYLSFYVVVARFFGSIAAILAGLSVAGGAFASHALKDKLSDRALAIFETGSKYQMYHALARADDRVASKS